MNYRIVVIIACLLALGSEVVITAGEQPVAAPLDQQVAEPRLGISIAPTKSQNTNETPVFHVAVENVGDKDAMVNLGMMLANGKVLLPDAIRLILIDSDGKSRELHFSDRRYSRIAGRVDDYLVPLRAGSKYTLRLSLDDFWSPKTKDFQLKLKPGEYSIHAELTSKAVHYLNLGTQGMKLMRVWTGKLESDAVAFRIGEPG